MTTKINIGTEIDLQDLIKSRLLIQANSGGGKSVIARKIIEESNGIVPFILMDIEGEYYTLKEKYSDIIVIGGQHADIPVNIKSAKLLPKEIIGNRLSVIIDVSDLKMPERIMYTKYFIESMMDLPMQYWVNYFVFIEEAHKLCGEQDKQDSAAAIKDLMSRGRKRGYCGILLTQRISKLHKDAAAECNNKFIGRTVLDIDLDRASKELGLTAQTDKNMMRTLEPGNFYAFGTSIIPNSVHKVKISAPKTKIPKAGTVLEIKQKPLTSKIKSILEKLSEPLPAEIKKSSQAIIASGGKSYEQEYKAALQNNSELKKQLQQNEKIISDHRKHIASVIKMLSPLIESIPYTIAVSNPSSVPVKIEPAIKESRRVVLNETSRELGKCSFAIVKFLGSFPERFFSKAQIAIATGYSVSSGGFNNSISELNGKELLLRDGGKIKASENVQGLLGPDFEPLEYSIHTYSSSLQKCEREIYEVLLERPNESFSKDELAELTPSKYSSTSGGFNNSLGKLNTLELIKRQSGKIQLNPELLELNS